MRPIDADELECVYTTVPQNASDDYKEGYGDGMEYVLNIIDDLSTISIPQWIPVSEKPIQKGLVLVTYNDGDVDVLRQPTAYRWGDIVAWMPLPKPWRGA